MDKERIRRSALEGKSGSHALRRLVVYSVALVALLVILILNMDRQVDPDSGQDDVPPPEEPRIVEPLARVDATQLASVSDERREDRVVLEPGPTRHLLDQAALLVYGDLEVLGAEPLSAETLAVESAARRGQPVWVRGELVWHEAGGPPGAAGRGEVRDASGNSWTYLVVTEPDDCRPGDVVRLAGFYLKQHEMLRPDRTFAVGPIVIAEELLRSSWPIAPVTELGPGALARVRDHDLTQASQPLESPEFYDVLSYVRHAPDEDFLPGGAPPAEITAVQLMQHTEAYRGQVVRVSGLLAWADQLPLGPRGENPLEVPFIWRIWLTSNRGTALVWSFDPPPADAVLRRTVLDVDGVYFRRYSYENRSGQPHTAAVVAARRMTIYHAPPSVLPSLLIKVTIGLVVVVAGLLAWAARRDRASAVAARQARLARQRRLAQGARPDSEHGDAAGSSPA